MKTSGETSFKIQKSVAAMLSVIFMFLLIAPAGCEAKTVTTFTEADGMLTLSNGKISLGFDPLDGTLKSLQNLETGTQFLSGGYGGSWSATIDTGTGDMWKGKTAQSRAVTLSGRGYDFDKVETQEVRRGKVGGKRIVFKYILTAEKSGKNFGGIELYQYVTLYDGDSYARFSAEIRNPEQDCVIMSLTMPQLTGLCGGGKGWSVAFPDKEGLMREDASWYSGPASAYRAITMGYPAPVSMQWMCLYNGSESIYYGVRDAGAEYKQFNFGVFTKGDGAADSDLDGEAVPPLKMAVTFWPTAGSGENYKTPEIQIGLYVGSWRSGADVYRDWLISEAKWMKKSSPLAAGFTGFRPWISMFYPNNPTAAYITQKNIPLDYAKIIRDFDEYGIDVLCTLGWHENGFDSRYPDYKFSDALGGADGFREGMAKLHSQGDAAIMYINNHISETGSEWYNTGDNGKDCALIDENGNVYHENYGTGLDYVAMCPMAEAWVEANADAAKRLRDVGADGLWIDQMMEMPAVLCFNREHGHSRPATAFGEGYKKMMWRIDEAMLSGGDNFMYSCEGVCDAYIQYIDVCGLMWARRFGKEAQIVPELLRYTLPSKMLGLPSNGFEESAAGAYGRAFLMGMPLLAGAANPAYKKITDIYRSEPSIYLRGRYMDTTGLECSGDGVAATVIIADNGKSFGVQVFNNSPERASVTISVDAAALGFKGKLTVKNIASGTSEAFGGQLSLTLEGYELRGYKFEASK